MRNPVESLGDFSRRPSRSNATAGPSPIEGRRRVASEMEKERVKSTDDRRSSSGAMLLFLASCRAMPMSPTPRLVSASNVTWRSVIAGLEMDS